MEQGKECVRASFQEQDLGDADLFAPGLFRLGHGKTSDLETFMRRDAGFGSDLGDRGVEVRSSLHCRFDELDPKCLFLLMVTQDCLL